MSTNLLKQIKINSQISKTKQTTFINLFFSFYLSTKLYMRVNL